MVQSASEGDGRGVVRHPAEALRSAQHRQRANRFRNSVQSGMKKTLQDIPMAPSRAAAELALEALAEKPDRLVTLFHIAPCGHSSSKFRPRNAAT